MTSVSSQQHLMQWHWEWPSMARWSTLRCILQAMAHHRMLLVSQTALIKNVRATILSGQCTELLLICSVLSSPTDTVIIQILIVFMQQQLEWIIFLPLALPGQYVLRGFYPIISWFIPIKPANKVVAHQVCNFSSVLWAVQAEIVHGFISSGDFLCFKSHIVGMLSRKEGVTQWFWGHNIRFQPHPPRIVWASPRQTAHFSPELTMKLRFYCQLTEKFANRSTVGPMIMYGKI